MYSLGLVAFASVLLAYFLTPFLRACFIGHGWVDKADGDRKIAVLPIPRAGGAVIAIAYLSSFAILAALHLRGWASFHLDFGLVLAVLPGGALVFIIGLMDDTKSLPPLMKFSAQIVACVAAYLGGVHIGILHGFANGTSWISLPVTVFWLLLCTNAFNLIDGMDGLSGGLGLFALLTLICYGLLGNNFPLLLATVPLAGALAGFLPFNFNPASVYLGDSGTYMIGFLLGCFAAVWSQKSATLLGIMAPLMALAVPLVDVLLVVVRRFLRQKPIFDADRLHIHHGLLDRGLTPRRVLLLLCGTASIGAGLALLSTVLTNAHTGLLVLLFCGLVCTGIKFLGYREFHAASRIAFRGTFRQALRSEMILETTFAHLNAAHTPAASWQVLKKTASELGFCRVGMKLDDLEFSESFDAADSAPLWTITIPLKGRGRVELAHRFEQDAAIPSVLPLTDLLNRCLSLGIGPRAESRATGMPAVPVALHKSASVPQRPVRLLPS